MRQPQKTKTAAIAAGTTTTLQGEKHPKRVAENQMLSEK
jgi:hypothetical protein